MRLIPLCLYIMGANVIFAAYALLADGWMKDVSIDVVDGRIKEIHAGAAMLPGDTRVDVLLPALGNLHSHSFQRAMAGLTEHRNGGTDSFWTWRQVMYRFVDCLAPEQVEAIAALAFMEMLEAGFAAVGEFHYLHHQPQGLGYDDPAELTARICAAAAQSGIGLTHLPVLYSYGGAGKMPLSAPQLRFGCDLARYERLVVAAARHVHAVGSDSRLGLAPHSLRATSPDDLRDLMPLAKERPIHIHIAEQPKEVSDIKAWLGARPVEWLMQNLSVDDAWCAIHATHMTAAELRDLAHSGAVAGLCPVTESNLGDGPFAGPGWLAHGGQFGVGTDSNVRISMTEELRTLEYSQRLRDLARNVMLLGDGSVGASLYGLAAEGAAKALGRDSGQIRQGAWADLVAIDSTHPCLCHLPLGNLIDGFVFSGSAEVVTDVWSAGRHMVRQGRHIHRDAIISRWRATAQSLRQAL